MRGVDIGVGSTEYVSLGVELALTQSLQIGWAAGVAAEVLQSAVQTLTAGASGDRIVFRSAAATPLTACCVLAPGERRCWEVEVALPAVLPPSHRGTALRWSYFLVATATLGRPTPPRGRERGGSRSVCVSE
jgi:hypothetical protein